MGRVKLNDTVNLVMNHNSDHLHEVAKLFDEGSGAEWPN